MAEFEIGTPVPKESIATLVKEGRYIDIWANVRKLKPNEALPIVCPSTHDAAAIAAAAQYRKDDLNIIIARRGRLIYLIKKEGVGMREAAMARRAERQGHD